LLPLCGGRGLPRVVGFHHAGNLAVNVSAQVNLELMRYFCMK